MTGSEAAAGWLLDELRHAGRENLDADHVERYDVKEDAGAAAEVELLRGFGLTRDSVVVDLGAGTGQFTVAVAAVCARVVAVDVSPVMLRRLQGAGRSWRSTSATKTPRSPGCWSR